ncbi:mutagen-sensitive 301 [Calliopsis andreniformis]|uniref:mutagen-sensitive 301 n=1 Tax=Calliopsis andreniformis TaxID=337506 RepID=UPI003FCDD9EE
MYKEINKYTNFKNHGKLSPEPVKRIDSILCLDLDDTVLRDIEKDNDNNKVDGVASVSPGMNDKTINNLAHDEWSTYDKFELHKSSVSHCTSIKKEIKAEITEEDLNISYTAYNDKSNNWGDETFMNEAFTQLESPNGKDNCGKDFTQVVIEDSKNHINKTTLTQDIHSLYLSENGQNEFSLKRNLIDHTHNIPRKTCRISEKELNGQQRSTSITPIDNYTFYGLPNKVKEIFSKVRGIDTLYKWQDECLNLDAIKDRKNLIYALPTSGGKTLVAEILMLKELICNKKNAIFVLPFVAIVQEKVQSMAPFALELGFMVEEYAASKGVYPPKKRRQKKSVYMCTIEKALGLINSLIEEKRFHEIGIIVVDELHLLGESGGRGASLEVLLTKALCANEKIHIIGMSATIGNLNEVAEFLNADLYTGNFRPIEIKEYVKCEDKIWLVDLRTEELLTDVKKINYKYTNKAAIIDPDRIAGLVTDVIPQDSCLIFCSSRKNCENVALLLSKMLFTSLENFKIDEKQNLLNALQTEEGLCPILSKTIKFGVAYHHSGLTSEERRLLEDAFRAGTLSVICCTSTLAAGVNLPARRVILRSPYVGNQFLNLSKYKQMIGRAGRAGMGNVGESIIICKEHELPKVKELLMSKMDDSLSTLHVDKDKGLNNLILSSVLSSLATTRSEIHEIVQRTLLNIQQQRLNVNVKHIADQTMIELLKSGVMKVKEKEKSLDTYKPNITVEIPTQDLYPDNESVEIKRKKVVTLRNDTELELCNLGRAAMKGCMDMQAACMLYQDLKKAQEHLILLDYLHLLYLVTPYDMLSQVKPVGSVYYDVVLTLSETQMKTARLLGINEITVGKIRNGIIPKSTEPIVNRFYITLILYDLWTQHAVYNISEKYQVNRGIIQNLLTAVSSFAFSVVRFCQELDEFWAFRDLLNEFSKKLSYCCPAELEALMELPLVKIGRARQLYNAGYRTIKCIAKTKINDLQMKIPYLSKRAAQQIIEAAKLLILEKIEDLKDEADDFLDDIDVNTLRELKI